MKLSLRKFVEEANKQKSIYTAGPSSLLEASIEKLQPCFGRNDTLYNEAEEFVLKRLKELTKHENIIRLQGSASLAIEIALINFCRGSVLDIDSGYYSERMYHILNSYKKKYNS